MRAALPSNPAPVPVCAATPGCLRASPVSQQRHAQPVMRCRVVGIQPHRRLIMWNRLREIGLFGKGKSPVVLRVGRFGLVPDNLGKLLARFNDSPLFGQCDSEVVMGIDFVRFHLDHDPVLIDRLIHPTQPTQRLRQIGPRAHVPGLDPQRLPVLSDSFRRSVTPPSKGSPDCYRTHTNRD